MARNQRWNLAGQLVSDVVTPDALPRRAIPSLDLTAMTFHTENPTAVIKKVLRRGHTFVGLSDVVAAYEGRGTLPHLPVLLTYDDGRLELKNVVKAVIDTYGVKVNSFVTSDFLYGLPVHENLQPSAPGITWADAVEFHATGLWEWGNHTKTHASLASATAATIAAEVGGCQSALMKELGVVGETIAYPFGAMNAEQLGALRLEGIKLGWTYVPATTNPEGRGSALAEEHPLWLNRANDANLVLTRAVGQDVLYSWAWDAPGERNVGNALGFWSSVPTGVTYFQGNQLRIGTPASQRSYIAADHVGIRPGADVVAYLNSGTLTQTAGLAEVRVKQYATDLTALPDLVLASFTTTTANAITNVTAKTHADCRFVRVEFYVDAAFNGTFVNKHTLIRLD